jgi:tetratricopeptide (TPR) repeat protein
MANSDNVEDRASGYRLMIEGRKLTKEQARKIADKVRRGTGDLRCHLLLLGYYFTRQFRTKAATKAHSRQVLWMIENQPAHPINGSPHCHLSYGQQSDHDAIKQAKKLWIRQIKKSPGNANILANAASFFSSIREHDRAKALLNQAKELEPDNAEWPRKLSAFFELRRRFASDKSKQVFAQKALAEEECAFRLETSAYRKLLWLDDLAWKAYTAGDHGKAEGHACTILDFHAKLPEAERDGTPCDSIHNAYLVMGSIALDKGDIQGAIENLIASVTQPHPSPGNRLTPDMTLAKRLLEIGDRDSVLRYIEISAAICNGSKERDKRRGWIAAIKKGRTPKFERFTDYKHD